MKISIIIPVGDKAAWGVCEESIQASITAYRGDVVAEVLPCWDLEHRGAYIARNEGLAQATGDWIAWVDCDDVVERNWFSEIAGAIAAHSEADIIQFEATEVKDGKERPLPYRYKGNVTGDAFARELLRNDGMPAWLWTRVFRRKLFDGMSFDGRVKQDYRMFLRILPRVKKVWSIGRPLYRYIRHGHGLSNYVQSMNYHEAGNDFEKLIDELPAEWRSDAKIGLALTMADVALHSEEQNGSVQFVRRYLWRVLLDFRVSVRLKCKAILSAIRF